MKNSTLLRLFFISIGLPLTCASSSPPTSSALTPKPASSLVDTTNTAPVVQLKNQGILVLGVSEESQISEKDEQTKRFEELINKEQYGDIAELGKKMSVKELLKCLCQVVTTLDQFKGIYWCLWQRNMVPDFLAHGEMVLVRRVIVEVNLLETGNIRGRDCIYDTITLSLREGRHDRVAGLFEAAKERLSLRSSFEEFVEGFFRRYHPEKDSMPLKRFLTLQGEEFSKKHPATFEVICERLVWRLKYQVGNLASRKLLIGLVGQPSMLAPVAFAEGFLYCADDADRTNFIEYGHKEALEEGLKRECPGGNRGLWAVMVSKFKNQFSGEYPSTDEARTVALKDFKPTKQDREEEWAKENAPILLAQLETLGTELPIAKVLLPIIAEYAITWVVV